ncbi:MAG: protein kinase, partial [Mycobacteriaceae bacterium]|nr:protein kinase [Mycobacteriaceae bacterium]
MEEKAFGRYRLIEVLGRGGMGEVWRAFDTETDRVVALKVLPAQMANEAQFAQRFRREAFLAASLTEPHMVPIHNFGEIDGRLYVDMRLIDGHDLAAILAEGPLPPHRAVGIIEQIASALDEAHRSGLVHRDVKPSNILVTAKDFAYLIDFGIARVAGATKLTDTGNVIGTWAYLAPERVTSGQTDPRCDVYSLACVLHECLTGSQPFPGDSIEQQIGGHLGLPPPRPSQLRRGLPAELDTVIATGMAKNPDERYSMAGTLASAAKAAITAPLTRPTPMPPTKPAAYQQLPTEARSSGAASTAPSSGSPWWRRKSAATLTALLAVLLSAAIGVVFVARDRDPAPIAASPTSSPLPSPAEGPSPMRTSQVELPFPDMSGPSAVAVDNSGAVYVTDFNASRVLRLAPGADQPTV